MSTKDRDSQKRIAFVQLFAEAAASVAPDEIAVATGEQVSVQLTGAAKYIASGSITKLMPAERGLVPETHKAKRADEYVSTFKAVDQTKGVSELYSFLCQVVHPRCQLRPLICSPGDSRPALYVRFDPATEGLVKALTSRRVCGKDS